VTLVVIAESILKQAYLPKVANTSHLPNLNSDISSYISEHNELFPGKMDGLLAEISQKRKALEEERGESSSAPAQKYMRRADIERAKEEEIRRKKAEEREREDAKVAEVKAIKARKDVSLSNSNNM
jgi:hypothetical protein